MSPDSLDLSGKVAIVTGSGRENGIGAGIALALARNGASVVVNYTSDSVKDRAEAVSDTLRKAGGGGKAIVVQAAVDTLEGARHLVRQTLDGLETDHIDILGEDVSPAIFHDESKESRVLISVVNNAGVGFFSPVTQEPNVDELSAVFRTNVLGPFYMVHAVIPHMPRGGRIVNISSTNSKRGNSAISTYAASKAALDNLTWTWAEELGRSHGITVNSVAPGPVKTDIYPAGKEEEMMATEVALTRAERRPGTPEDIGDAVLLLVNDKSRWITGQYIGVSGGVTC